MNCVTFHYDNTRTGWLRREAATGGDPQARPWGKYIELSLGSPVRGAVLFLEGWVVEGGQHDGEQHTMLYVATSANQVFAFSEERLRAGDGTPIWQRPLGPADPRKGSNIPPPVGVCSTMVLDPERRRLFVVALEQDAEGTAVYHIYALSLDTGAILAQRPLVDPGAPGRPTFIGKDHDQRGGLLLAGGWLYVGFADFLVNDNGPYHGWLVGVNADDFSIQLYFPVTRNVTGGGVWGPGGLAASDDGGLYIVTGNSKGAEDASYWDNLGNRHPGDIGDYFEAVARVDRTWTAPAARWQDPIQIPGWFGAEDQGAGLAVADLDGDGRPELIVLHIDNPSGENHGYYRIGWKLDAFGNVTGGWSAPIEIPGWFGAEDQGAGLAVADLDGDGRPELIVFHIDNPSGENHGYYRIGRKLDTSGHVTGGWTEPKPVPGWFGAEDQGAGLAVADLDGDGRPELIVFHIDNPSGENHGYYRVGRRLDTAGDVTGGWTTPMAIPGWFGAESQGGGVAVADLDGDGRPELIVFHIDNPSGENHGYYRIGRALDAGGVVTGGWTDPIPIPGWFGAEDQGGGIAVADLDGDGRPELIALHIDNPSGENHGYYHVGFALSPKPTLELSDWYLPTNAQQLNKDDADLGGSSALLIPDYAGTGRELLITGGKDGRVYLLDRRNLGHWGGEFSRDKIFAGEARCAPAFYRTPAGDGVVFLTGNGDPGLVAFQIQPESTPRLAELWRARDRSGKVIVFGDAASSPLVVTTPIRSGTDNDTSTMVWACDGGGGPQTTPIRKRVPVAPVLRAFDAVTGMQLWSSADLPDDAMHEVPHYPAINCSQHSVFVGTATGLACYRLPRLVATTRPSYVVFHIDNPSGENHGYYRVGWNVGTDGVPQQWDAPTLVPGWFGAENQGAGVVVADLDGDGRPEMLVLHVDNPSGENHGYYRVGWSMGTDGAPRRWDAPVLVPGWFGAENQGAGLAIADIDGDGRPELIVLHIDNPSGENHGYYRIGWHVDATGTVTRGWSGPIEIPGWFGAEDQGAGIAIADLDGDGHPELIVLHIDNPSGENHGYYRIGWHVDATGTVTRGWSGPIEIPGWFGAEDQGAGIAVADLDGDGRPELIVFHIDNPSGENRGYYRIGHRIDTAGNVTGGWTGPFPIPGWFGAENQHGGIAVMNLPWTWVWV